MTHKTYTEDDLIQLSALQHIVFCERQCALIHIEQIWSENVFTAEGRSLLCLTGILISVCYC